MLTDSRESRWLPSLMVAAAQALFKQISRFFLWAGQRPCRTLGPHGGSWFRLILGFKERLEIRSNRKAGRAIEMRLRRVTSATMSPHHRRPVASR